MDWRIHQVAYVENLYPLVQSNFSTALNKPRLPSWIKSSKVKLALRPTYFLAMETTKRKFALARRFLASISPASILLARSFSSFSWISGYWPLSFRYILMESLMTDLF